MSLAETPTNTSVAVAPVALRLQLLPFVMGPVTPVSAGPAHSWVKADAGWLATIAAIEDAARKTKLHFVMSRSPPQL